MTRHTCDVLITLSPAQQRWQDLWGSRCPMTSISVAFAPDSVLTPEVFRSRLWELTLRHEILQDKVGWRVAESETGASMTIVVEEGWAGSSATTVGRDSLMSLTKIDLSDGSGVRCWLNLGEASCFLTLQAPSGLVDVASAIRLVSEILGTSDSSGVRYNNVAAWWWETLGMRREDGVVHWNTYNDVCDGVLSPLPWGSPSSVQDFRPRFTSIPITPSDRDALQSCAASLGVSVADLLCATWFVLLARWIDIDSLLLGDTFDGRAIEELQPVIGALERVLPLRLDYDPNQTFEQLVQQVHAARRDAATWQDYFILDGGSDKRGYLPFAFAYREVYSDLAVPSARIVALSTVLEPFTLQLDVCATPECFFVRVGCDEKLIHDGEAAALCFSFSTLMSSFLQQPTAALVAPPLLATPVGVSCSQAPERSSSAGAGAELQERLNEVIRSHSDQLAVIYGEEQLSYGEFGRRIQLLADELTARGVQMGDRVALCIPIGATAIIALLAILRAGAVYVPIDPLLPEDRIRYMIENCAARFMLYQSPLQGDKVVIEDIAAVPEADAVSADGEQLAYIIYTSGSTGRPKGVIVPHQAILGLVDALGPPIYDHLAPHLRVSLLASLSFDASVQQIFGALLRGHTLLPVDVEIKRHPVNLCNFLRMYQIDVVDCTPSLFELLVQYTPKELGKLAVQQWIIGGEALSVDVVRRFYGCDGVSRVRIANVYGLTECGVDSTAMLLDAAWTCVHQRDVPIGTPLSNAEILLLDPRDRLVPCGAVGEICISGSGLANEYINDEALTQARFVPHPFRIGKFIFRTGDRGWCDADGLLHFANRRDEQIKLRGHRIDLGEVRHVLLTHPDVEQATVLLYSPQSGHEELAAFVVGSRPLDRKELRSHLRSQLSESMVPRLLSQVDKLPLTLSGKLDRRALLAQLGDGIISPGITKGKEGPEDLITSIFQQVLKDAYFGPDDDFFEAGGNSLLALESAVLIAQALSMEVEVRSIYQHRTANELCRALLYRKPTATRLVALRPPAPEGLEVFFLPPRMGVSQIFSDLAARLPGCYSPWGIDYRIEGQPLERSIKELSAAVFEELQARRKAKLVPLVGYSIGAAVAFELARQMELRGYTPGLVLIDSMPQPYHTGTLVESSHAVEPDSGQLATWLYEMRTLAEGYTLCGTVACDIVALEARDNAVPVGMLQWQHHTTGRFRHTTISGTHETLLAPEHLAALSQELQQSLLFLSSKIVQ